MLELTLIENDARRYIVQGIKLEKDISEFEQREEEKGIIVHDCNEYNEMRRKLIKVLIQVISIVNPKGKLINDLDIEILRNAEKNLRSNSNIKSRAVRWISSNILSSFTNLRNLFKKFDENILAVDPQLKNNCDLAKCLKEFEDSWDIGKKYLLDSNQCSQFFNFAQLIENLCEKYSELENKIKEKHSLVYIVVAWFAVLNSIEANDKKLFQTYFQTIGLNIDKEINHFCEISLLYSQMKKVTNDLYKFYNTIELKILEKPINEEELLTLNIDENELKKLVLGIKEIVNSLQKYNGPYWIRIIEIIRKSKEI